ncbi:MAG: hypothetical protein EA386_07890 [Rhodobacteraceae bacterium]|nr:MAG: hypothetical protein EA386_07890 [Paracoccaceae bacterium]
MQAHPGHDLGLHRARATGMDLQGLATAMTARADLGDIRAALIYGAALFARQPDAALAQRLARFHRQCRSFASGARLLSRVQPQPRECPAVLRQQAELATLAQDDSAAARLWEQVLGATREPGSYAILQAIGSLRNAGQDARAQQVIHAYADPLCAAHGPDATALIAKGLHGLPSAPPALSMITGNNGTGKTSVGHLLQAIGFRIVDADAAIGMYCRAARYSPLRFDLSQGDPQMERDIVWTWPEALFHAACSRARASGRPVAVVGGFGRVVAPFVEQVDHVIHLAAPSGVIARRLAKRNSPTHRPGTPGHTAALRRNDRLSAQGLGATPIRANQPVWQVCTDILAAFAAPGTALGQQSSASAHQP